ncbi:hypothetical protein BD780_000259 [Clostridium tetanomorphum]|uniref:DNRLRE domain-containing protein n=1 Tax=Clostridium tetanomorphum TaxID=1553 RepID=A0A923E7Y9_CLOTT|nr:DNRLRE domain-containing protein [Clostridium tetanomorphum]KAJ51137.1 collagen triple helix repeat-containing protein [Clostridium tetanomorphum DSM 665]MBC2398145.1 DNRLRE domain-containing protein [Clostridium tetanomorphum]MBP1864435.1 hypothetical protein [Clostridium tetanomorphum]NRS83034.1 hypothetical protein [Clostridium tetanomorphum]NRZ98869.1 hypothetical protein [Clostridium tetanomorphum]
MAVSTLRLINSAYISEYYPDENYANPVRLFVGRFQGAGDIYRSLLKFDLSEMPENVTINSADLRLYIDRKDVPNATVSPQTITVYPNLQDFDENIVTWNNQPPIGSAAGSYDVLDGDLNSYVSISIIPLVTGWLDGSIPNTGIMLEGVENNDALIGIAGIDGNDYTVWAELVIDYLIGSTTIHPTETLNFAGAGTQTTSSIPLGARTEVSFNISLAGVGAASAVIQLSDDGVTWTNELVTPISISAGGQAVISSSAVANFARLSVIAAGVTVATIVPSTREN